MKVKEVDVYIPDRDLTEAEVDELNIRLNKNTGTWDYDLLANEFELSDLIDWGFTSEELLGSIDDDISITSKDETEKEKKKCPHCGGEI